MTTVGRFSPNHWGVQSYNRRRESASALQTGGLEDLHRTGWLSGEKSTKSLAHPFGNGKIHFVALLSFRQLCVTFGDNLAAVYCNRNL
jgi:hypothetical protein